MESKTTHVTNEDARTISTLREILREIKASGENAEDRHTELMGVLESGESKSIDSESESKSDSDDKTNDKASDDDSDDEKTPTLRDLSEGESLTVFRKLN